MRHLLTLSLLLLTAALPAKSGTTPLPPVMGWSSWNTYRVNISDRLIRSQADAMVRLGLDRCGYRYINIDDGYFGWRDSTGLMHTHPERFPEGLRPVADHIHRLGLKAGLYSDAGVNTCGSMCDDDLRGVGSGLYGHEQQDMDLYMRQWGFDFIKIDFCGGKELGLDEERQYTAIHRAILATGRTDVSVNICRWAYPGTWAERVARSWRTTGDIQDNWASVRGIIGQNLYLSAFAGEGHYNDMDMLEIGRSLTPTEEETHFGMWCIMSSPLLIGCDLTQIRPASLDLLRNSELIAINQDPLCLQAYVAARTDGDHYCMVKDIEQRHGRARAVAFYNPTDSAYTFHTALETLELGGAVRVRDLVHRRDLGRHTGIYTCTVPAHGAQVCRMEGERRLEATSYEAEWTYRPCFNALGVARRMIVPIVDGRASGGMMVTNIGGRAENSIEWRDLYSEHGGRYRITIHYAGRKNIKKSGAYNATGVLPTLCGQTLPFVAMEAYTEGQLSTATFEATLRQGYNTLSLTNPQFWTPDIDRISVEKIK